MARIRILIFLFFGLLSFAFPQNVLQDQTVAITISAAPIPALETDKPSQTRFGSLEYRGGLVLTSTHKSFGGISALYVQPDGEHFLAVSDRAAWFRGGVLFTKKIALSASPMRTRLLYSTETANRLPGGTLNRSL